MGKKIAVVGGGLAGLTSAILLRRQGFQVLVIEKNQYPFHRVCGEYISNEVLPLLNDIGIVFSDNQPANITKLEVSSPSGKLFTTNLDLGGFGISRYQFDYLFYKKALAEGVKFELGKRVVDIKFDQGNFSILLANDQLISADLVIASYGKRSNLDQKLRPNVFYQRSPYVGIKYHIRTDHPDNVIQLSNFEGGYCGLSKIEGDKYCLCYLSENRLLKKHGSIDALEHEVLQQNPILKHHFLNSDFLFEKPEVINEISFDKKPAVQDHLLFCGDSAGMITPLCGNGMAIALRSAILLTKIISGCPDFEKPNQRRNLENAWTQAWRNNFSARLATGRFLQKLFGSRSISNGVISFVNGVPSVGRLLVKKTHGKPFNL
ncbi:NAD(P)-binding protein [Pedobacter sp. HMF7647]|uniref:NAD(P)-binding protein n=1 Tax=Hufsiella arboris TaxID=2695275 RepID=A0A7K1Y633_9SPHI|nr:NAD(P)/FAD-dependent oxidoreductase [Hufsiella arboris]MXV49569.1 NAD(P)-binding protein [Hufsiella arboris]